MERAGSSSSWKWLLALFTLAGFIETIFWGHINAFTPLFLPQLGVARPDVARWTGLITAIASAVGIPFLPLWGALADRFSRQPIIIRSFVVHGIAAVICLLSGSVWTFLLGRAFMNLALGNSGLMMTTVSERAPANRQAFAFAVMNSSGPVGIYMGPLLGGPVVDHYGFRLLLGIDAGLMLAVVLGLALGYRDAFRGRAEAPILKMAVDSVLIILRSPRLRVLFPALFLLFSGWMLAFAYAPLTITAIYHGGDPAMVVGLILGGGGLLAFLFGPLIGLAADRWGHWPVVLAGSVVEVLLWPVPAYMSSLLTFGIAWTVLNGLTSGVFAVSFSILASSARPEIRGRVMSFSYLPINIGSALGPAIGAVVTRSSVFAVFPVAGALTAAGIVAMVLAWQQQPAKD